MVSIAPIKSLLPVGEQRVVFRDITWQGYQQLLEVFGDRRAARTTFDRGVLEITMPFICGGCRVTSATNLIEIDLLRTGIAPLITETIASQYRVLISRSSMRPAADLYAFNLRDPIPVFLLPLLMGDSPPETLREREPLINLETLLDQIYEEAALDLAIDYTSPPKIKLQDEDWEWVKLIAAT
jgi:Protein of unknown function (DUF4058)